MASFHNSFLIRLYAKFLMLQVFNFVFSPYHIIILSKIITFIRIVKRWERGSKSDNLAISVIIHWQQAFITTTTTPSSSCRMLYIVNELTRILSEDLLLSKIKKASLALLLLFNFSNTDIACCISSSTALLLLFNRKNFFIVLVCLLSSECGLLRSNYCKIILHDHRRIILIVTLKPLLIN